jgi:hypothetical protein
METEQAPAAMETFVVIFRQGPRTLSDSDRQRRAEETTEWARHQNGAGYKLDPRILPPERAHRGPKGTSANAATPTPITALLFVEAHDLDEAAQVAESHPALRFGASVEVRPWTAPAPVAAAALTDGALNRNGR